MSASTMTNVADILQALDGGLLADKIGVALSEITLNTCLLNELTDGKAKGKLILTLEIGCDDAFEGIIAISHKLVKVVPTKKGKDTSEDCGRSMLYAERGGRLVETAPPENLKGQFIMQMED